MNSVESRSRVDGSATFRPRLEVGVDTRSSGCVVSRGRTDGVSCSASAGGDLQLFIKYIDQGRVSEDERMEAWLMSEYESRFSLMSVRSKKYER